jgi:hypothetical protein
MKNGQMARKREKGKPERVGDIINRLWPHFEIGAKDAAAFERLARSPGADPEKAEIEVKELPDGLTLSIRRAKGRSPRK